MSLVEKNANTSSRPMVQVIDAHKSFGPLEILKGISTSR